MTPGTMRDTRGGEEAEKRQASFTFVLGACWVVIALLTARTAQHLVSAWNSHLAAEMLSAIFVFAGLYWIGRRTVRNARPLSSVGFVKRPSQWDELGRGAALGWGISLALLMPALFTLRLQSALYPDAGHWTQAADCALLLVANALTTQLLFTGLLFRSLTRATSGMLALAAFSIISAGIVIATHTGDMWQAAFVALAQTVFSLAALRTRAVWMSLGIQLGWGITLGLLFGVSSFYWPTVGGPVQSYLSGPRVLTGSYLGPEASLWAFFVMLFALAALWRATRDYAWDYAFDPIVGAGRPMDVAPPREHTRMEAEAEKQGAALVQIMPAVSPPSHFDREG